MGEEFRMSSFQKFWIWLAMFLLFVFLFITKFTIDFTPRIEYWMSIMVIGLFIANVVLLLFWRKIVKGILLQ